MSFSPFDPAVMRLTLGRASAGSGTTGALDRLDSNAAFEEARLKDAYRQIETMLAELLAMDFVASDGESLQRAQALLLSPSIDAFSEGFDRFADHVLARLEEVGASDDAGATARARLRASLDSPGRSAQRHAAASAVTGPVSRAAANPAQPAPSATPPSPQSAATVEDGKAAAPLRSRMRLQL